MKELIKRIKAHDGEVKVTPENDNKVVVEFVPKLISVECDTKEQFNFALRQEQRDPFDGFTENRRTLVGIGQLAKPGGKVIPFTKYISDNDLKDEWEKYLRKEISKRYPVGSEVKCMDDGWSFIITGYCHHHCEWIIGNRSPSGCCGLGVNVYKDGKWATIIEPKMDLVKGEVYSVIDTSSEWRFKGLYRHKMEIGKENMCRYFSTINDHCGFQTDGSILPFDSKSRICKPATNKQKAKLIKAEIKNGWLWDGNELLKL